MDEDSSEYGMFVRFEVPPEEGCFDPQNKLWWDRELNKPISTHTPGADPYLLGEFKLDDGTPVKPAFQLLVDRVKEYTAEWASTITGIPERNHQAPGPRNGHHRARRENRIADSLDRHLGQRARVGHRQPGRLPRHARTGGAFQRLPDHPCHVDPDEHSRHHRPTRRLPPQGAVPAPDSALRQNTQPVREDVQPNTPLDGMPLGWPADPDDLFVDDKGEPVRIDKAFSWEYPLSVHGLMHNAITNAWRGDPYKIDTLLIFMANMAWNSSMNTSEVRKMLNDKDENGEYKIPFLIVADAFQSEMVGLCRPGTTGYHLPGTPRLHVHAGPPDFRIRRPGRLGAYPRGAAQR